MGATKQPRCQKRAASAGGAGGSTCADACGERQCEHRDVRQAVGSPRLVEQLERVVGANRVPRHPSSHPASFVRVEPCTFAFAFSQYNSNNATERRPNSFCNRAANRQPTKPKGGARFRQIGGTYAFPTRGEREYRGGGGRAGR
jgi:hypothetical protein